MANRAFHKCIGHLENDMAIIHVEFEVKDLLQVLADVYSFSGKGVSSVIKTGTGTYTIIYQDPYNKLLGIVATQFDPRTTGIASITVDNSALDYQTNVQLSGGAQIKLIMKDYAGTNADPTSTSKFSIIAMFRNSGVA